MTSPIHGLVIQVFKHLALSRGPLTPSRLAYYVRRARRAGAWYKLSEMQRALIKAAASTRVDEYRDGKLKEMLAGIIASIEAHTALGALLTLGLKYALERGLVKASLGEIVGKLGYIKYLGRSVMSTLNYYIRPL